MTTSLKGVSRASGPPALRRLQCYAPAVRDQVAAVTNRHERLADLAASFPALLFALARPHAGVDVRPAIELVIAGAPLARVAAAAGVPMWLRRLAVGHLVQPLPPLPDAPLFAVRIVNHLPAARDAQPWLAAVAEATACGHDLFAVWVARERVRDPKVVRLAKLRLVALWAWFSWHAGTTGHRLAATRWRPQMRFEAAHAAAVAWREMVVLHLELQSPLGDIWLNPGAYAGYEFVPLATMGDIAAEAQAMRNCVRTYGAWLAHNRCRLWSIRRDGARVATLCVGQPRFGPLLTILELKAAGNRTAPVAVWWVATRWLNQHDLSVIDPQPRAWDTVPLDARAWREMWRPYWLAKRRIVRWLPLAPSLCALWAL